MACDHQYLCRYLIRLSKNSYFCKGMKVLNPSGKYHGDRSSASLHGSPLSIPGSIHAGFVVVKGEMGQIFRLVRLFSPSVSFCHWSGVIYYPVIDALYSLSFDSALNPYAANVENMVSYY